MTDYTNVTYNSYLEYASEYYGLLHDKIYQENRLSNMINSKLILYILFKYCTSIKLFFFFLLLFLK